MAELTARRWRSALGVLASSALLAAAIAWAEPGPMFDALRRTTPGWLAAAAGLSLASNVVQSAELVRQALVLPVSYTHLTLPTKA